MLVARAPKEPHMLHTPVRWLIFVGFFAAALGGCSSDPEPATGGAGSPSAGSGAAGSGNGGSPASAGTSNGGSAAGQSAAGTANGGSSAGGSSGSSVGGAVAAGSGSGGSTAGGSGGNTTMGGSAAGGAGSGMPTAVASIMGLNGKTVTGTATFTQGSTMTKLVLNLSACPDGVHASHLHENKDCGDNGEAAGGHWINGEGLADYTCTGGKATLEMSKGTDKWTVGDGKDTDVTKHALIVHEMGGAAPGGRIGCGTIVKQQ